MPICMGVVFLFKADNMEPQPCVTATPLSLEERRLRHVSKDEGCALMVRDGARAPPHHKGRLASIRRTPVSTSLPDSATGHAVGVMAVSLMLELSSIRVRARGCQIRAISFP